jgi:hypothetical protein
MSETQNRLTSLIERLRSTDSWPWSNIEAWKSAATPLVRRGFADCYDDFVRVAAAPNWTVLPRFSSGGGRSGAPRRDNFASATATEERENRKKAEQAKINIVSFFEGLLDLPAAEVSKITMPMGGNTIHAHGDVTFGANTKTSFSNSSVGAAASAQGARVATTANTAGIDGKGATMGHNYTTNITNSNIGAAAVGEGARATGTVTVETTTVSQADYQRQIDGARKALIDDEDKLNAISEGLSEALGQFLRIAREIQVDQLSIKDAQTKMKATLDDTWVELITPKLKGQALPESLEVVKELLKSPVTAALTTKMLIGA